MEKEPVEKITLLDVLNDLGLQDEVAFAGDGATNITLRSSSIFACICDEAKTCVSNYNKVREGAAESQRANLQLLDKWLSDHVRRNGLGMAVAKEKAELLLRCLILVFFCFVGVLRGCLFSWVLCLICLFSFSVRIVCEKVCLAALFIFFGGTSDGSFDGLMGGKERASLLPSTHRCCFFE